MPWGYFLLIETFPSWKEDQRAHEIKETHKAQEVNKEIAQYVDVMIGNEEDFESLRGLQRIGPNIFEYNPTPS